MSRLTALEFYSGIGGMRFALAQADPTAKILDAFDINHVANMVYQHTFGDAPRQVNLEHITAADLDSYAANLWLLAPPCQPYTRQGLQLGAQDARSRSFLHLLHIIASMQHPPEWLLLENVVGFELSGTHKLMVEVLAAAGYCVQDFILTPTQYGVPYSRPRYFCVASKRPFPLDLPAGVGCCRCTPSLLLQMKRSGADQQSLTAAAQQTLASHTQHVQTIGEYLSIAAACKQQPQQQKQGLSVVAAAQKSEVQAIQQHKQHPGGQQEQQWPEMLQTGTTPFGQRQQLVLGHGQATSHQGVMQSGVNGLQVIQEFAACKEGAEDDSHLAAFKVPDEVLEKHADVIDIVTPASCNCNCFTKSYGQFTRGTGSLLATVEPSSVDPHWQLVGGTGGLFYIGYPNSPSIDNIVGQGHNSSSEHSRHGACGRQLAMSGNTVMATGLCACGHNCNNVGTCHCTKAKQPAATQQALVGCPKICCTSTVVDSPLMAVDRHSLAAAWKKLHVRYFTPSEVASLHSFPENFIFPASISAKQSYKLLGNSLSVVVVADLLQYLLLSV